ncbi:MAG: dTMP kinase [Spirochaetales bacterium]|nr:dTMP kinase [Spirochaetales bacterium]
MNYRVLENFIVLEGLDGAGTTTQRRMLTERLTSAGVPVFSTWEPTDNPIGLLIREILARRQEVSPGALAGLFAADRYEHIFAPQKGIMDQLGAGKLVVCDRYLFSSLAYQSESWDFEEVLRLNSVYPLPSKLLFLDIDPETSHSRLLQRNKPELFDEIDFLMQVRDAYYRAFELYRDSDMELVTIDAGASPESIHQEMWSCISSLPIFKM